MESTKNKKNGWMIHDKREAEIPFRILFALLLVQFFLLNHFSLNFHFNSFVILNGCVAIQTIRRKRKTD